MSNTRVSRKHLRKNDPLWGCREMGYDPRPISFHLRRGLFLFIPNGGLQRPILVSPKSKAYPLWRGVWEREGGRAGDVAVATLEENRALWAKAAPNYPGGPQEIVSGCQRLFRLPLPELWFDDCWPLGRLLLHQMVELPEYHWLGLYSGICLGNQPGHFLLAGYVDHEERLRYCWEQNDG